MRTAALVAGALLLAGVLVPVTGRFTNHAPQQAAPRTFRGQPWFAASTREACAGFAHLAIRRATVVNLEFTHPVEYKGGTWSARGVVDLKGAPDGRKRTTFLCALSADTDSFSVDGPDLTMGP